jgi:hypothetical protein
VQNEKIKGLDPNKVDIWQASRVFLAGIYLARYRTSTAQRQRQIHMQIQPKTVII